MSKIRFGYFSGGAILRKFTNGAINIEKYLHS